MGLTRPRNLHTGKPVWAAYRHLRLPTRRLKQNRREEVVVVGAGISGALIAQALTELGMRPLILDRRHNARLGSTAASTALLQFELDTPLIALSKSVGRRTAEQAWKCSRDAVNELRTRAERLGIAARQHSRPSLYLAGNVLDAGGLRREVKARRRIGLASEFLEQKMLKHHFNIDAPAAILSHGNLEADPLALTAGFLQSALRNGARLHAPHEVIDLQRAKSGSILTTRDGVTIQARHVVLCTGYEFPRIVPMNNNRIMSTWAIATSPQPSRLWPQRALIWEASDPYLYLRSTHDGRVICGGEDEPFEDAKRRDARIGAKTSRIQQKLAKLIPGLDTRAAFAWTGSFGASSTGMPTIGQIPNYPGCYAVLGYGGNGITFSMLAATLLSAQIVGKRDLHAGIFKFYR